MIKDWLEQESGQEMRRPLALFPEGAVGNGKAMLPFKTGAFLPGVPVQPLLIKYNNKYDTLTWAWKGIGIFQLVLLTLSQPYTRVTLRYLPAYYPNQDEKEDSRLFAKNVNHYMAKELGIGVSKYTLKEWFKLTGNSNLQVDDRKKSN